jgi:hypothetical protein
MDALLMEPPLLSLGDTAVAVAIVEPCANTTALERNKSAGISDNRAIGKSSLIVFVELLAADEPMQESTHGAGSLVKIVN